MKFWGVEVKSGEPLRVDPGEQMIVRISLVALGEKKNSGNEPVRLYMKVGDQKLVIGTLSHDKFPQMSTEIVLERPFELSHSWKDGSVFFSGYRVDASDDTESDDDEPAVAREPAVAKSGVKQVNFQLPNEVAKAKQDNDDSDESDDDTSSDDSPGEEEEKKVTAEVNDDEENSSDDDEDDSSDDDEEDSSDDGEDDSSDNGEDDSSDEDTPEKAEESKKRPAEVNTSKAASNKKAKFVTPQKTETKKPHVHVATPHPSKQGRKNSGSNGESSKQQQQTPKSAGAFGCKSCNRTFTSEMGMQSHTKAKHSVAA